MAVVPPQFKETNLINGRRVLARLGLMFADTLTAIGIYITVVVLTAAAITDLWM